MLWGLKRHALVDTQGNLQAVKVLGADGSDQRGRALLERVKGALPRIKLMWGDNHSGVTFLTWVQEQLALNAKLRHLFVKG